MKEAHLIYSLSSSINQLFCISYSLSRDKGSEAVKSCNSGDFIHSWYLQKKWYRIPVVNNNSSSSSSSSSSNNNNNGGGIGGGVDGAEDDVLIEHPFKIQQKNWLNPISS